MKTKEINKNIDVYLNECINETNPYEERGNIVIMSKYEVGKMLVLDNLQDDMWDDDDNVVEYERLSYSLDLWIQNLKDDILDNALEYMEAHNIGLQC